MSHPIPEDKRPAVERALMQRFGTTVLDAVTPLAGGLSGARVYRIRVGGIVYLLRIEGARDELRDPGRWYGCMEAAAEGCIAPRVHYACPVDGVMIVDLIEQRSLELDYMGGRQALLTEMGQTVRALHALAPFPPMVDYLGAIGGMADRFQASGILAPEETRPRLDRFRALAAVYRTLAPEPAPSHNDLNPGNILYDGRRLWLIDWESAFQADRWIDVACLANFYCHGEADERALLTAYLGAAPTRAQLARLFLARRINHVFYAMMLLNAAAAERPGVVAGWPQIAPLADQHRRLADGEAVLASWEGRVGYGQAHLDAVLEDGGEGQFEEAARLAA